MSKWFEVTAVIYKAYAVEVADNEGQEDALRYVDDEVLDVLDRVDVGDEVIGAAAIETMKRFADEILSLPEGAKP